MFRLLVVSDIHFAGPAEQARKGFEARAVPNPGIRMALRAYRKYVWLDDPMAHNHRLDAILQREPAPDLVVGNGDFTLDTAFVGVSDDAACASARECLERLRAAYPSRFEGVLGDHELGKKSFVGGAGGLRRRSLERCESELGLRVLWRREVGIWNLIGVASTLAGWPLFRAETPASEHDWWEKRHLELLRSVDQTLAAVPSGAPILLFCHDPSALPFLRSLPSVAHRIPDIAATIIGHLHTPLVLAVAGYLAGFPRVNWAGNSVRRYTAGLHEARCWKEFKVRICPSPAGVQLLKDGGYLTLEFEPDRAEGLQAMRHRLPWDGS